MYDYLFIEYTLVFSLADHFKYYYFYYYFIIIIIV